MSRPVWLRPPSFLGGLLVAEAPVGRAADRSRPTCGFADRSDVAAAILVLAVAALLIAGAVGTFAPLSILRARPVSLDPFMLPGYAVRTVLRMLAAMAASLVFTLTYGTLAAKSRRAGIVLIPLLDILQSVPVLGYLSFTVTFFLLLFPHRVLGAELASIFAIFTSQAWNMAFSFIQALRTVPRDLDEATRGFRFSAWQRFWRLEFPFAVPGLVWNMMMSMSGGWFFVVASEAITVGDQQIALPGIGSYVALAIQREKLGAIGWAILAMTVVILIYDQLLFRPLVVWADNFRVEQTAAQTTPRSWFLHLLRHARLMRLAARPLAFTMRRLFRARLLNLVPATNPTRVRSRTARILDVVMVCGGRRRNGLAGQHPRALHRHRRRLERRLDGSAAGQLHPAARGDPDRPGLARLGADRCARSACGQSSPNGSSRWPSSWPPFPPTCCSPSSSFPSSGSASTRTSGFPRS